MAGIGGKLEARENGLSEGAVDVDEELPNARRDEEAPGDATVLVETIGDRLADREPGTAAAEDESNPTKDRGEDEVDELAVPRPSPGAPIEVK